MPKWRTVRVSDELLTAAEGALKTGNYRNLSEFVTDAVQQRLDELRQSREKKLHKSVGRPVIRDRLLYAPNHMWVMVTPEGNIRLGLSDFAQSRMEGVASIQTDKMGSEVRTKEPFGVVETWLFKFSLFSPVAGKIIKINETLGKEPSLINKDPYEAGWIAEIRPTNLIALEEELKDLMKPDQYETWVAKLRHSQIVGA